LPPQVHVFVICQFARMPCSKLSRIGLDSWGFVGTGSRTAFWMDQCHLLHCSWRDSIRVGAFDSFCAQNFLSTLSCRSSVVNDDLTNQITGRFHAQNCSLSASWIERGPPI